MDLRVVIDPNLCLDANEIVAAWNENPETRTQAEAHVYETPRDAFLGEFFNNLNPAMIRLAGIVGLAAYDIIAEALKTVLVKKLTEASPRTESAPELVISWVNVDGGKLMVITEAE